MIEIHAAIFIGSCDISFGPPSRALVAYQLEKLIDDADWVKCENSATTDIKAQVPSTWAKRCMLDNCTRILWLDMTTLP